MSYATADDLRRRIGKSIYAEIYDGENGEADALADLESAAAEIDGCLSLRDTVPVTHESAQSLLWDWNLTLAEERAFARPAGATYTEKVKTRVAQVRIYLEMIRNKAFHFASIPEKTSGGADIALVDGPEPVFTRDRMKGY